MAEQQRKVEQMRNLILSFIIGVISTALVIFALWVLMLVWHTPFWWSIPAYLLVAITGSVYEDGYFGDKRKDNDETKTE